jgi:Rab5 GDP/GTP exchange factor
MAFCDRIFLAIKEKEEALNADILIPVTMLALVQAKPKNLISDLRYIQRFRNHSQLTGRIAYNLTNIVQTYAYSDIIYSWRLFR